MSTKSSIYYADGLHVFTDCMDCESLAQIYVEAPGREIAIPFAAVSLIADYAASTLSHIRESAAWTDEQIEARARKDVAERVSHRNDARGTVGAFLALAGLYQYGSPDDAEQVQIDRGIAAHQQFREQCAKELKALEEERQKQK